VAPKLVGKDQGRGSLRHGWRPAGHTTIEVMSPLSTLFLSCLWPPSSSSLTLPRRLECRAETRWWQQFKSRRALAKCMEAINYEGHHA